MKALTQSIKPLAISGIFFVSLYTLYAWTGPTQLPPGGNVASPINTSSNPQTKSGALTTGGLNVSMADNYYTGVSITGENFSAGDPATRLRIQDKTGGVSWFMSANNDGKFAIHQGGVGDRVSVDNANGNVTLAGSLTAGGLIVSPGTNIFGNGSTNSNYGSLTVNGSKNGWSGINFLNSGTLMMGPNYSGFYNKADNHWRMYVSDGAGPGLMGNVYANDFCTQDGSYNPIACLNTRQARVTGSCAVGQSITAINADGTVVCGGGSGGGSPISLYTSSVAPSVTTSGHYIAPDQNLGRHTYCALSEVYQGATWYRTYAHVFPTTNYSDNTYDWTLSSDGTYAMATCFDGGSVSGGSGSASYGWVPYGGTQVYGVPGYAWVNAGTRTPTQTCVNAGYTNFVGSCRSVANDGTPTEGTVNSNYTLGYWAMSCQYGGVNSWATPASTMLCVK